MADKHITLTQSYLNEIFEYRDGHLYRTKKISDGVNVGDRIGTVDRKGYVVASIFYKKYSVHRLIYLMKHGYTPSIIDHIDGNKLNNCIENLRPATVMQNAYNSKIPSSNTSGIKGVSWDKKNKKWAVTCSYDGKNRHIGRFIDLQDAINAIDNFRKHHHKEFERKQ